MADPLLAKLTSAPPQGWPTDRILPDGFRPMLAAPASGPLDSLDHAYEVKWEGLRALAGLEGGNLVLGTGNGQDSRFWFPELTGLRAAAEPNWVLLDGEIVQFDGDAASHSGLQSRLRAADQAAVKQLQAAHPATYLAYDILRIGDSWLLDVSWEERRDILLRAVKEAPGIRISPVFETGAGAMQRARHHGLESVVAKRMRGRYMPGEKTRDWLSIKPLEVVETVIGGWLEGRGARAGAIGSLLLGRWEGGRFVYIGHTGTGLDARTLHDLHIALVDSARKTSPFDDEPALAGEPHWVEPRIACRVRHQGWTAARHMKGPTFLGLTHPETVEAAIAAPARK